MSPIDLVLQELLATTRASRVTLRQDVPGDYAFPVTHEARVPAAPSLREERTVDLRRQPVLLELQKGHQVVHDDCRTAFDDPAFQTMLETYGGLAAQIVTPVFVRGRLTAIVSLHQLGTPRSWTEAEAAACASAAARVGELV